MPAKSVPTNASTTVAATARIALMAAAPHHVLPPNGLRHLLSPWVHVFRLAADGAKGLCRATSRPRLPYRY